jgi:ElaB/YqjD/DUF883 family membrane-anchored ribosome-binding protein
LTTPEQIQHDIEGTRRALSADVDRLSEKVSPGRVVGRRVDRVKSGASSVREKVMGSLPDPSHVTDAAGDAASSVGDAVTGAPQAVKQQTQGNPLGAGLVAFGVGLVLSSLIPATEQEKSLAAGVQDKAMGPLQDKAKELASELQPSLQQSAEQVKQVATNAASDTADQARSAVDDVRAPLQQ